MFDLFNQLNDEKEFRISCQQVIVTGSRLSDRECVPVYMKRARTNNTADFLLPDLFTVGLDPTVTINGVPQPDKELWFHNQPKHNTFNTKVRELASQHPELTSAILDLQAKKQRLLELEQSQRKQSSLGRFFSGFGSKDEE